MTSQHSPGTAGKLRLLSRVKARLKKEREFARITREVDALCRQYQDKLVFLLLTPVHANMGDHAISYAETKLFQSLMPDCYVYEVSCEFLDVYRRGYSMIRKRIGKRPIFVNGGGSLGTIWFHFEQSLRTLIRDFPDNDIVVLPETIYYEDDAHGREELQRARALYRQHRHLHLCARERISYDMMRENFPDNDVRLFPDMVLYLDETDRSIQREGITLCLRNDKERTMSDALHGEIVKAADSACQTVRRTDMTYSHRVKLPERSEALQNKLNEFRSSELVVTDRLHSMIFSAITATPCIVFSSKSHKLQGVYEWIRDCCPYIRLSSDPSEISALYQELTGQTWRYPAETLCPLFDELAKLLQGVLSWEE